MTRKLTFRTWSSPIWNSSCCFFVFFVVVRRSSPPPPMCWFCLFPLRGLKAYTWDLLPSYGMQLTEIVLRTLSIIIASCFKHLMGNRESLDHLCKLISMLEIIYCCFRFYLNKDWGCVILREIDFLLKICWSIPCLHPSWKVHTWIEICASLNHRKKTKADGSRLIPRKHTERLVLLSFDNQVLLKSPPKTVMGGIAVLL